MLRSEKDTERKEIMNVLVAGSKDEKYSLIHETLVGLGVDWYWVDDPGHVVLAVAPTRYDAVILVSPDFTEAVVRNVRMSVPIIALNASILREWHLPERRILVVTRELANLQARLICALMEIDPELPEWVMPEEIPLPDWLRDQASLMNLDWPDP